MELWIRGPDGNIVGVYRDGKLTMHMPLGTDGTRLIAFELFSLLVQMMNLGSGSMGADILPGVSPMGDSDFGTASDPEA